MAKDKDAAAMPLMQVMLQSDLYKRTQGRVARQLTFAAILLFVVLGAWRLYYFLGLDSIVIPAVVGVIGAWIAFRIVNLPKFADFLISVEAEMYKVSWPGRGELFRSVLVVILVIFGLATILIGFDLFWKFALSLVGVSSSGGGG